MSGPAPVGANTTTPAESHVPPRADCDGASACGEATPRSSRFNTPLAKKPSERPSGAQNGYLAPSVPASGWAVVVDRDRSHRRGEPSPEATKTIWRPSGDRAKDVGASLAGVTMSTRVSGGPGGGVSRKYRTTGTASTAANKAATANAVHARPAAREAMGAEATAGVSVVGSCSCAPLTSSSSCTRASPMDCSRARASFFRQRPSSRRNPTGVADGNADQSGSLLITDTKVSAKSSPGKALLPVSISYSTAPKAQTSARRSTTRPFACSGLM